MIHTGHRQRLRNKALEHGFGCIEEHERLELLLGYAVPRKNTNEMAHLLIDKAGSLRGVFDMDWSEIKSIEGLGLYAAFMIKLIGYIMNCPKAPPKKRVDLSKYGKVKDYLSLLFGACEKETLYALYIDKKFSLISCEKVADGSEWQMGVNKKSILNPAIVNMAAGIILAHNHPRGLAKPSSDDINFTVDMERACSVIDTVLIEHIIYADGEFHPIMKNSKIRSPFAIEYDGGAL